MVEMARETPGRLGRRAMGVVRGLSSSSERGIGNLIDVPLQCVSGPRNAPLHTLDDAKDNGSDQ